MEERRKNLLAIVFILLSAFCNGKNDKEVLNLYKQAFWGDVGIFSLFSLNLKFPLFSLMFLFFFVVILLVLLSTEKNQKYFVFVF